jgi:Copper amine oxidase N-terminal domain
MKLNRAIAISMAFTAAALSTAQYNNIRVRIDGKPLRFGTAKPIYKNGRVLVPLRGVFEALGADVRYDEERRSIRATSGSNDIRLMIGDRDARVNGVTQELDEPAMIIGSSTYVPLRFVSESFGAQVRWNDARQLVAIMTTTGTDMTQNGRAERIRENGSDYVPAMTVIPVTLNTTLSSDESRSGDKFTAQVHTSENRYGVIPANSFIEGHVVTARSQRGSDPGILELAFDRLRLPSGRSVAIQGSLYSLDSNSVTTNSDGTMSARNTKKDNRAVYAGYGAGTGLIIGLITKRPLENTAIGGILGYIAGSLEKPKQRPSDVTLRQGQQFGVRLNEELAIQQ